MKTLTVLMLLGTFLSLSPKAGASEADFLDEGAAASSCEGIEVDKPSSPAACSASGGVFVPGKNGRCVNEQREVVRGPCCCSGG